MRRWWRARPGRPLEDLDDDHAAAAAGAWRAELGRRGGVLDLSARRRIEQCASAGDIVFAAGAGEEAIVTDAMEALRQNVEQDAANEFVGADRHGALAVCGVAGGVYYVWRRMRARKMANRARSEATPPAGDPPHP